MGADAEGPRRGLSLARPREGRHALPATISAAWHGEDRAALIYAWVEVPGMTQLSDLVPALQRELAVPGTFDDVFPDTTEDDLAAALADGFSEAQLRGFFSRLTLVGEEPNQETSEDLSAAGQALVVIFTAMKIIRSHIRALNSGERYKAGATEYEINRSAMLLRDELSYLTTRLDDLIAEGKHGKAPLAVVIDGYLARNGAVGAFYAWERP